MELWNVDADLFFVDRQKKHSLLALVEFSLLRARQNAFDKENNWQAMSQRCLIFRYLLKLVALFWQSRCQNSNHCYVLAIESFGENRVAFPVRSQCRFVSFETLGPAFVDKSMEWWPIPKCSSKCFECYNNNVAPFFNCEGSQAHSRSDSKIMNFVYLPLHTTQSLLKSMTNVTKQIALGNLSVTKFGRETSRHFYQFDLGNVFWAAPINLLSLAFLGVFAHWH